MATTWVLHTETKGTGAQMVPLESVKKRSSSAEPLYVPSKPARRDPEQQERKLTAPHRFRIIDLMARQPLVDDAGIREAVDALKRVRSTVDVSVYVWHEERDRWRLLTLAEQRALLDLARG